jgi:hypothetical protein
MSKFVGGGLRLKGGASLSAPSGGAPRGLGAAAATSSSVSAAALAGLKRGRDESTPVSSAAPAPPVPPAAPAAPIRERGLGRLASVSGTAVRGADGSKFLAQAAPGDKLVVRLRGSDGGEGAEESRAISFVLADGSLGLSAPFRAGVDLDAPFFFERIPRVRVAPEALAASRSVAHAREAAAGTGVVVSSGGGGAGVGGGGGGGGAAGAQTVT